jgi:hypothetical protein
LLTVSILLIVLCLLAGCQKASSPLKQEIAAAQAKWTQHHINDYAIQVAYGQSIFHYQIHVLTVRNGEVVEQSARCQPAPIEGRECKVQPFEADHYTVAGLFSKARDSAELKDSEYIEITFDESYGFPKSIAYRNPKITDGDWGIWVLSFSVIQ